MPGMVGYSPEGIATTNDAAAEGIRDATTDPTREKAEPGIIYLSLPRAAGIVLDMSRATLAMFEEIEEEGVVRVVLAVGDRLVDGTAPLKDEIERPFALAQATLAAAAASAGLNPGFSLIESRVVELVTGDVAVVTCTRERGGELLAGAAPIRNDGWERAVCRASLDAVNRVITKD